MVRLAAPWAHLSITLCCDCHTPHSWPPWKTKKGNLLPGRKKGRKDGLDPQRGLQTHHLFQNTIGRASGALYLWYCSSSLLLCSLLSKWTELCKESLCCFYLLDSVFFKGPPLLSFLCLENGTISLKGQAGLNRIKSKQEAQVAHWVDVLQSC